MYEQTIWLPPRATAFTEICEACEEESPVAAGCSHAVVSGALRTPASLPPGVFADLAAA